MNGGRMTNGNRDLLRRLNLKVPLILAPLAGGPSSPQLVAAASRAGALGSMGAAYSSPSGIAEFVAEVRKTTDRPFAINLFISHPPPKVLPEQVAQAIRRTERYRKELALPEPHLQSPKEADFDAQFEAVLRAKPAALSFIFGVLPRQHREAARKAGLFLIGAATTPEEARELEEAEVDAITLQGIEAGGHRAIFEPEAIDREIGVWDLLARCAPRAKVPLIAAGGIMTRDQIGLALERGAQAVQMGTAFLACKEAGTSTPYRAKLLESPVRKTKTTRVFSGRLARGMENRFLLEMESEPGGVLPFPAQNDFTRDLRNASVARGTAEFLSLWAGSGEGELWQGTAGELIARLFP